jgi:hypothetical protein
MTFISNDPYFAGKGGGLIATTKSGVRTFAYPAKYFPGAQGLTKDSFRFTETNQITPNFTADLPAVSPDSPKKDGEITPTGRKSHSRARKENDPASPTRKQSRPRRASSTTVSNHSDSQTRAVSPSPQAEHDINAIGSLPSPSSKPRGRGRVKSTSSVNTDMDSIPPTLSSSMSFRTEQSPTSTASSSPFITPSSTFSIQPKSPNTSGNITRASTLSISSEPSAAIPSITPFQFQGPTTKGVLSSTFNFTAGYQPTTRTLFNQGTKDNIKPSTASTAPVATSEATSAKQDAAKPLSKKQQKRAETEQLKQEARTEIHKKSDEADQISRAVDVDGDFLNQVEKPPTQPGIRRVEAGTMADFLGKNVVEGLMENDGKIVFRDELETAFTDLQNSLKKVENVVFLPIQ